MAPSDPPGSPRAQKKLSVFPGWPLPLQSLATNTAIVVTAKAPFPPATAPQLGLSSCKGGTGSFHLTELADQGGSQLTIPQWEGVTLALCSTAIRHAHSLLLRL